MSSLNIQIRAAELIATSAPDIYPDNTTAFIGALTVDIVNNAKDATIFFTTDGSDPTPSSSIFTASFRQFIPGKLIVKAIAVPDTPGRGVSVISEKSYTIIPSSVLPPVAVPPSGRYRGSVIVLLAPFGGPTEDATVEYAKNVRTPTSQWLTYTSQLIVAETGLNVVHARTVFKSNKSTSPYATFFYRITPPLVFDVTAECAQCGGSPTAGEWFTVWLQEPLPGSLVFLSITATGCSKHAHKLDDTDEVVIGPHRVSLHFRTLDPEPRRVYVCIQEGPDTPWMGVTGRDGKDFFELQKAVRSIPASVAAATTVAAAQGNTQPNTPPQASGGTQKGGTQRNPFGGDNASSSNRILLLLCAFAIVLAAIIVKRRLSASERKRRGGIQADDAELDEREELRVSRK